MYNLKTILALLLSTAIITGCKKKETTEPEPITPAPPPHVNKITAKVDNNDWANVANGFFVTKSSSFYSIGAYTSFSNPKTTIQVSSISYPSVGTFTFGPALNFGMRYVDANNVQYTARTGTINITTFDTLAPNAGIINKFKATFSFKTDTVSNVSHDITNGVIDFEKP